MNHRDHSLLILDSGLFCSLAITLAPKFGKVYYWSEWIGPFPRDQESVIATGYEGVTRIKDRVELNRLIDSADKSKLLIVVADVFFGGDTESLRKRGYRVWGPGPGEKIEIDRYFADDLFNSIGIPKQTRIRLRGTEALKAYMKSHEDVWFKMRWAKTRGDSETHRCVSWELSECWFNDLEVRLAGNKHNVEFLMEQSTPDAVEISSERYLVDKQFPAEAMFSMEQKGEGSISKVLPTSKFPKQITSIDNALLQSSGRLDWHTGYRAAFTIETRVTKDATPYPIDPCCRWGRPAWGTWSANIENLDDILWSGAEGVMVDPKHREEWVAELMIEAPKVGSQGCILEIPSAVRPFVFLSDGYYSQGLDRVAAQDISNIGSVVGLGSSLDDAVKACCDRADKIRADKIIMGTTCFDKSKEGLAKLKDHGVEI